MQLQNQSDLPAKFEMQVPDSAAIQIVADKPSGVIAARATVTINIMLKVYERAVINFPLKFAILGSTESPLEVAIGCIGEGAVVSVSPTAIEWGKLQVLQDDKRTVILTNESLINASFRCRVEPDDGVFSVDVTEGELRPAESRKIFVHTHANDNIKFSSKLIIEYSDSNPPQVVPLTATGIGSTIAASPNLEQVVFGSQFSGRECTRTFTITNHSQRTQRLFFILDSPPADVNGRCVVMRGSTFKKTRTPACPNPPDADRSVFGFYPERLVLEPGQEASVELRGLTNSVLVCQSMFL